MCSYTNWANFIPGFVGRLAPSGLFGSRREERKVCGRMRKLPLPQGLGPGEVTPEDDGQMHLVLPCVPRCKILYS